MEEEEEEEDVMVVVEVVGVVTAAGGRTELVVGREVERRSTGEDWVSGEGDSVVMEDEGECGDGGEEGRER